MTNFNDMRAIVDEMREIEREERSQRRLDWFSRIGTAILLVTVGAGVSFDGAWAGKAGFRYGWK